MAGNTCHPVYFKLLCVEYFKNFIAVMGMEPSRQNALAWRELGDIYSALNYLEDAIDAYRQALQEAGVPASPLAFSDLKGAQEKVTRHQK